jgi:hypothetical protein
MINQQPDDSIAQPQALGMCWAMGMNVSSE